MSRRAIHAAARSRSRLSPHTILPTVVDTAQANRDGSAQLATQIIFDKATALRSAEAVTSALVARAKGAGGQHIEMAMLDLALEFMWCDCYYNECWESSDAAPVPAICDTDMCSEADKDTPKISPKQAVAANARYEPPDILQR